MKEALKLALEALELAHPRFGIATEKHKQAITVIKAALAQDVQYTNNGTAGREADVRPTGFFFQMPKPVGEVYGWHGSGKGQPMCRFDTTEAEMPIGTELYTTPPQQEPVNAWLIFGKDNEPLIVSNDLVTTKKYKEAGRRVEQLAYYTTTPQPEERNFCPRCGKRTADLTVIHTCTPPQEKNYG